MKTTARVPQNNIGTSPKSQLTAAMQERRRGLPAWVLLTQLFIGLGWLRAASEKIIDLSWWRGQELERFLAEHQGLSLGWYQPFLDYVVSPNLILIAIAVVIAQLFAAVSLISGRYQSAGLAAGVFMNLNFLAAGAVNPSAFYLLSQGALALWLAERSGLQLTLRILTANAVGAAILAVISTPYISTLDPASVIDDPALMMVMNGALTVLACDVAHRNLTGGAGLRSARI